MTEGARQRLGHRVRERRRALGITAAEASRLADLNPKTWEALEKGTRTTRDSNHAGIERTLQWRHGSIEAILGGGEPTLLTTDNTYQHTPNRTYTDPDTGELYEEQWEREIWDLTRLDMAERRKLIYYTRAERARQEAEGQRRRAAG